MVSALRCWIQLNILGYVLAPLFSTEVWLYVVGYIYAIMLLLGAYETAARAPKRYPWMLWHAIVAICLGMTIMICVVVLIVAPVPWYNAQYLVPMAGMLINNQLTGTSIALKLMLDYLVTNKEYLEILLSFGATPMEAAWPGLSSCYRTALLSNINSMSVMGQQRTCRNLDLEAGKKGHGYLIHWTLTKRKTSHCGKNWNLDKSLWAMQEVIISSPATLRFKKMSSTDRQM